MCVTIEKKIKKLINVDHQEGTFRTPLNVYNTPNFTICT